MPGASNLPAKSLRLTAVRFVVELLRAAVARDKLGNMYRVAEYEYANAPMAMVRLEYEGQY
jgi:hypothetical protein